MRKKSLQSEAEAIVSELTAELPDGGPPIGIDTPLVDREGFPRADIDVYRARTLRKRFKEIQTDHRALEKEMGRGLEEAAALAREGDGLAARSGASVSNTTAAADEEERRLRRAPKPKPKLDPKTGKWVVKSWDGSVAGIEGGDARSFEDLASTPEVAAVPPAATGGDGRARPTPAARQGNPQQPVSFQDTTPFAVVDQVFPDSPADEAGLVEGDVLLGFGPVHAGNHQGFRAIAELLPRVAGDAGTIGVTVRRKTYALGGVCEVIKTERVELKPRTWGGRGLLGCHIQPYSGE